MNSIPHPEQQAPKPKPKPKQRRIDYEAKLSANEDAIMRWSSKLKYAATKMTKLTSKRRRLLLLRCQQNQVSTSSPFQRKFS